ncbi:peptidase [Marinihelvus fidelis]|uniref:Peptidase n=1 Tax=Marinihelvus fidelis TaxID=2613842 RepID=A0A5N0TGI4_9GAMM|nr:M14 family metallopeptidase [Marinihelvus fidelis]KAA9134205.1 peptidase [Marinihelvus fidelis]
MRRSVTCFLTALTLLASTTLAARDNLAPTPFPELEYHTALLPGEHDPAIPVPEDLLGFTPGKRPATYDELIAAITAMVDASDRAVMLPYATTHEGRDLYHVIISTPDKLGRRDEIQADVARLADPRELSGGDADTIISRLPGIAWMGYSIHGNESSGADAALMSIYHLLASTDPSVTALLEELVIIIDPVMNPDGRARFTKSLQEARGAAPNVDDQSLLHRQSWPWGRGNHYLYDLNRDYILGVNPETRGKVDAINRWYPQIVIDGHEMGSQETYHFSPSSQPINAHRPDYLGEWGEVFAADQGREFDQRTWPYFNREYFDDLYPGYTTYSQYRGALNILYEQARYSEDGVRRGDGRVVTYAEAVHHHVTSTFANLSTLAEHHEAMYRDYLADRRANVSSGGPYGNRSFVVMANGNHTRLDTLADVLAWQGFEIFRADDAFTVSGATNQLGETVDRYDVPAGSLVIPNRQPEARLLATMLEFDTPISDEVLRREREGVLRDGDSIMYDTTAWNLGMMFGLETLEVPSHLRAGLAPWAVSEADNPAPEAVGEGMGWLASGLDDASVGFAARLLEQGVRVRLTDEATRLDGTDSPRGSVVVLRYDNPPEAGVDADGHWQQLATRVTDTANELNLPVTAFTNGAGEGEFADAGSHHFVALQRPQIAIVTRGSTSGYDYGTIWHSIDRHLGIRHSHLDRNMLGFLDLRRYNVIVLPDLYWGQLSDSERDALKTWTRAGGTLIAIDGATGALTDADAEFSSVRTLGSVLDKLDDYETRLQREWLANNVSLDDDAIWSHTAPVEVDYPWRKAPARPKTDELKQMDAWQAQFMPSGAYVAARVDQHHWLTSGVGEVLPVLVQNNPLLMSGDESRAVVRLGVYREVEPSGWQGILNAAGVSSDNGEGTTRVGWAALPEQHELRLRMSGLLWPEAAQRVANAAWVTRESVGDGQLILFAGSPMFRGASYGTNRLLLNALVYGPGLGADAPISP